MLAVKLLGQFSVALDGQRVEIPSHSAQALLAWLLLHPGIAHPREVLADRLWPDSTADNARANLRHALWQLRQVLNGASAPGQCETFFLCTIADVTFNRLAPYTLDAEALEQERPNATADELAAAVTLYAGELLPGHYEPWLELERERLAAVFERRMAHLLELLVVARRWEEVVDWAEHWIAFGAAPEPAYRALMRAHAARGNLSGVRTAYQRCTLALQETLEVEPSSETRALALELLPHDALPARTGRAAGLATMEVALQQAESERLRAELYLEATRRLTRIIYALLAILVTMVVGVLAQRRR